MQINEIEFYGKTIESEIIPNYESEDEEPVSIIGRIEKK